MFQTADQVDTKIYCLVVEDSAHDQEMIRRAMRGARLNAEIEFAPTLACARKAMASKQFSIILCDNSLPDGSGSEFASDLALEPHMADVPIVIVSGWPSPFMWDKARQAGLSVIDKTDDPLIKLRDFFRSTQRRAVMNPVARIA